MMPSNSEEIMKKLYERKAEVAIEVREYPDTWRVELVGDDGTPDCKIGHFGYNHFYRTPKGIKREKYKGLPSLISAVKRVSEKNGMTVTHFVIKDGRETYRFPA